jgi:hypothetical protein
VAIRSVNDTPHSGRQDRHVVCEATAPAPELHIGPEAYQGFGSNSHPRSVNTDLGENNEEKVGQRDRSGSQREAEVRRKPSVGATRGYHGRKEPRAQPAASRCEPTSAGGVWHSAAATG